MHLKRQKATTKLPISRKGTKYIARALSNVKNSVPIAIALRDMLKLARTSREIKLMINQKLIKINNKPVKDLRESIQLFNNLEAGKTYILALLKTGKFTFEEAKNPKIRLCKVINKTPLKNNKIQLNLHDGSNILLKDNKEKISIGDSLYLNSEGKIERHLPLEKEKNVFIISGKYIGLKGKVLSKENKTLTIALPDKESPIKINQSNLIAI